MASLQLGQGLSWTPFPGLIVSLACRAIKFLQGLPAQMEPPRPIDVSEIDSVVTPI